MGNNLGKLVKNKRLEAGLSLRQLAKLVGVSHTEIARIESGERECPSLKILTSLADVLRVPGVQILEIAGYGKILKKYDRGDANGVYVQQNRYYDEGFNEGYLGAIRDMLTIKGPKAFCIWFFEKDNSKGKDNGSN